MVVFEPLGVQVAVAAGTTVRAAAEEAGVALATPCAGLGTCGRCSVTVRGGLEDPTLDERTLLSVAQLAAGQRLACRARVTGDVSVLPATGGSRGAIRAVASASSALFAVEPPSKRGIEGEPPLLGAAIDVGTTTLVARLVDLTSGDDLGSASALNPQHIHGHDVLSRISHVGLSGVAPLRFPLLATIEGLVLGLLDGGGHDHAALRELALCGNPTMLHLLLGIDPTPLGSAPYEPVLIGSTTTSASELGLPRLGAARAYILPGISAFIGADIVADVLATGLDEQVGVAALLDLGTNGELVLRTPEGLVAASTAAGPALEGALISSGMFAEDGAIERVELRDGELALGVIGGGAARGLCGSGVLDLVAALLDAGVLDATGLLRPDAPHPLASRVRERDGVRVFEVAADVRMTQHDIRHVQLAVAAVAAGIGALLDAVDCAERDLAELLIAGGFGLHVSARSLVRMGVIPEAWSGRVRFVGNTALMGTVAALLDSGLRRKADAIATHVRSLDLARRPDFQSRFLSALTFPEA